MVLDSFSFVSYFLKLANLLIKSVKLYISPTSYPIYFFTFPIFFYFVYYKQCWSSPDHILFDYDTFHDAMKWLCYIFCSFGLLKLRNIYKLSSNYYPAKCRDSLDKCQRSYEQGECLSGAAANTLKTQMQVCVKYKYKLMQLGW